MTTGAVDVVLTVNGGDEISRAVADSPALLGFETGRYRPPDDLSVGFCDWPFTHPNATFEDHLDIVREERPKYAVAPDVEGDYDLRAVLSLARKLDQYWSDVAQERAREVAQRRKEQGLQVGRPKKLDEDQLDQVREWNEKGLSYSTITALVEEAYDIDVTRQTVYRYCKDA